MSLILKCDIASCKNNSINYSDVIWSVSIDIKNQYNVEHICEKCINGLDFEVKKNYLNSSIDLSDKEVSPSSQKVVIYSDGACKGNPGLSGSGLAVYIGEDKPFIRFGNFDPTGTNNSAELLALLSALEYAEEYVDKNINVEILSDSQYSINSITKWAINWEKNDWKKKGGSIKNLRLINKCYYLYNALKNKLSISYVKAHSGITGNELADRAAGIAITNESTIWSQMDDINIEEILAL